MIDINSMNSVPHGEDRLAYLKKITSEADNEKNLENMMWARYFYIRESVFYGDTFKALVAFPELMKLFEENPDVMSPKDYSYAFKWLVEDCSYYYQISKEQIDKYLESFREFLLKFGYSERVYYLKKSGAYQSVDCQKAYEALSEMEKYSNDEMNDGEIYEKSELIHLETMLGSPEKAISILNELLDNGYNYDDFPPQLFGDMSHDLAKHGMFEEADHYAALMMFYIKDNVVRSISQCAYIIEFKLITEPNYAYSLFCKCINEWIKLKNPSYKFYFANAAHRLMQKILSDGTEEIELKLIPEFELYSKHGIYRVDELEKYFLKTAKEIAEKFDERNGNTMFSDELAFTYPKPSEEKIKLAAHGKVTPVPSSFGVMFRSEEDIPSTEEIISVLKDVVGCDDISEENMGNEKMNAFICRKKNGEKFRYASIAAPVADELINERCSYYLPEGAIDDIKEYTVMLIIASGQIHSDTYEEIQRVIKIADRLNTGGCPVAVNVNAAMTVSSVWLSFAAKSDAPPAIVDCIKFNVGLTEEGADTVRMSTLGLNAFGSRELLIDDVQFDDIDFCMNVLGKIAESISLGNMPDENVKATSGLIYDGQYYVRFLWSADASDKEINYAKVKLNFNSNDEKRCTFSISELPDEYREKLSYSYNSTIDDYDAERNKNLFRYAAEYFRANECSVKTEIKITEEDSVSYVLAELVDDGTKARIIQPGRTESVKTGDIITVNDEDVIYFRIETESEKYTAETIYILFS